MNTIDLDALALKAGEGRRMDVDVAPEPLVLGGESYEFAGGSVPARLELSRTSTGYAMHMTATVSLEGPCMRCLGPGSYEISVESREVDQASAEDEELISPYVHDGELDLGAWAHDAIALALPQTLECRPGCAGLCPVCGVAMDKVDPETHKHDSAPDPRWAKLRELMD